MEEGDLKQHLEFMQLKLYSLVDEIGSLVDPQVVELSQKIDGVIVTLQRLRLKEK